MLKVNLPAYFVAEIDVTDPAVYKTYVERNTSVVNAHGGSLPGAGWQDHSYGWRATETCRDHRLGKRRQSKGMVHFGCLQGTIRDKAAKFRGFIAEGVS